MKFLSLIGCLVLLPLYGQWAQPTVVEQVTVISTPPRYRLLDGIKVAIENVTFKSKEVNVANVMEELESMQSAHDVSLPYRYTKSSTTGKNSKGWLKGENKKKRVEVESMVSKMIALNGGENCIKTSAPVPDDYEGRDAFISAYVEYRLDTATEALRNTREELEVRRIACGRRHVQVPRNCGQIESRRKSDDRVLAWNYGHGGDGCY